MDGRLAAMLPASASGVVA